MFSGDVLPKENCVTAVINILKRCDRAIVLWEKHEQIL